MHRHFLINGNQKKKALLAQCINTRASVGELTWDNVYQVLEELSPSGLAQVEADKPDAVNGKLHLYWVLTLF